MQRYKNVLWSDFQGVNEGNSYPHPDVESYIQVQEKLVVEYLLRVSEKCRAGALPGAGRPYQILPRTSYKYR